MRKARRRFRTVRAWTMVQRRNDVRTLATAESIAALQKATERRIVHRMASDALSGALEADDSGRVPSPRIHVALVGLANLHYYLGNPNARMSSHFATEVMQTIDLLADELRELFRRATKAGGQV